MACFADINVSQASVSTYARRGGIFNMQLTANLPRNLQGRSHGWAWGAEAPKRNPSPPNEFQPMKSPGLAKSAQMYGGIGLTAGNKPTYG